MASTEIVKRFPASAGFRTRADIPTFTMMTEYALTAFSHGHLTAADLSRMTTDFGNYRNTEYWNAAGVRGRALLMSACMGHQATLIRIEARSRQQAACINAYADAVMAEIHENMNHRQIPRDVGSFSCLHDYCAANDYLMQHVPQNGMSGEAYTDVCSAVSDEVDRRLAAEALARGSGERCAGISANWAENPCGRLIRFVSGHVLHIDDRSHACNPCEFC